jgi:hypothetical protein
MPTEDSLASRFDYLFEPLDVDEPVGRAGSRAGDSADETSRPNTAPLKTAFAAFVLGTLGMVAVIAVLLLQRPNEPGQPVGVSPAPAPLSTTLADVPSMAAPIPPPTTTDVPIVAPRSFDSVPAQLPMQRPTSAKPAPRTRNENTQPTRAPISVAPESRAPFPHQTPPQGGGGGRGGGLLGGGGLL